MPCVVLDRDGRIRHASAPLGRTGSTPPAGTPLLGLVPPGHRETAARDLDKALAGKPVRLLCPVAAGDGPWTWYLGDAAPVVDRGRILGTVLHLHEATALHHENQRLRRSERLMVDTQGTAHLGTWEWDITEPHAWWSEELYRIYGLDPATHTPSYEDYLTRLHPGDIERVKAATERVFHEHVPYSHDERIRHADGTWRHLHTWTHPVLDDHGRLVRLVGVCQDITERKQAALALVESEARFRALFEEAPIGIATLERDGRVLTANPAMAALVGRPGSDLPGMCLETLIAEDDRARCAGVVADVVDGALHGPRMTVGLRAGGWARLKLSRILTEEGPLAMALLEDVTAERHGEEADRLALGRLLRIKELELVSERRGRLLSMASHELKNPMTPILLQLHILKKGRHGPLNEKQTKTLEGLYAQVRRMSRLVQDVLDTSRIEHDRLGLQPQETDLRKIVQQVMQDHAGAAAEWGIQVQTDAPEPVPVHADPERIGQVLANLVGNALKFTPRKGRIRVEVRADAEGDAHVAVSDTGPGLTPEDSEQVFQEFSLVRTKGARERGHGLGLYIAKSLVEAHGGRIWVDSRPGEGATFRFTLPRGGPVAR